MKSERTAVQGREKPPTYREVADELRARIRSGALRPGQRMPTQAKLADEFGVERGAVRQALRVLQSEHLLTNVSKGSPATVAPDRGAAPLGPAFPPQPTGASLAPRIAAAFEAGDVTIDAVCLMAVSLTLAMGEPLRRIHAGEARPDSVRVRVLLPSGEIPLAFPAPVDAAADGRLQRSWLTQRDAQARVLRHNLMMLRTTHGIDVDVTFRTLPFTPPMKLYVLNGQEALFAFYTIERREEQIEQERLATYGTVGTDQLLFPFGPQAEGPRDTAFVEQSSRWFEALWNTISQELLLPG